MNKLFTRFLAIALPALSLSLTACSDDDSTQVFRSLDIWTCQFDANDQGVWSGWNQNDNLQIGPWFFSHSVSEWGTSEGFVLSRSTDNAYHTPMYEWQFTVPTGGGYLNPAEANGAFMVAYWNTGETADTPFDKRSCSIRYIDTDTGLAQKFTPVSIMVNNNCYAYYAMVDGDSYCKKFGAGDYFVLEVHGVHADGTETTADIYLADCRSENVNDWYIMKDWTQKLLPQIGEVTGLYFTMRSSDTGEWGMNTPSYFAVDQVNIMQNL